MQIFEIQLDTKVKNYRPVYIFNGDFRSVLDYFGQIFRECVSPRVQEMKERSRGNLSGSRSHEIMRNIVGTKDCKTEGSSWE